MAKLISSYDLLKKQEEEFIEVLGHFLSKNEAETLEENGRIFFKNKCKK